MKNRSGEKIKLASIDELLGVVNEESAMEIEISKIHPFKNHPFKVLDDDAIVVMVDANIQREELLPSEKAFAYKMKLEAMKRQGVRTDLTCVQSEHKLGKKSRELLGEQVGISSVQVTRYIRLTELIPELLDLVDNKKLQFTVAVDISYIDKEVQEWIYEYISDTGFIKPKQIAVLRNQLNDGPINQIQMLSIFNNCVMAKKVSRSLTFSEL